jgi:VanZ family protein
MVFAGLFCVGYAVLDEYHQSFIDGRTPGVKDVCIDSAGVFLGTIVTRIVGWTGRMTIFRKLSKKYIDT